MHLNLVDVFWTHQGEGFHAGRRALFVRLPFCNLKCSWCDTEFDTFKKYEEADFLAYASSEPARFAVITGGEPTMNKQTPRVIELLKSLGFEIAIETNGNFEIPYDIDFVTVSPKRDANYAIHLGALNKASEFKYVVDDGFDFSILDRHDTDDERRYSLSPEFNNFKASLEKIQNYIKENPEWRISLQTHKWMGIP